MVTRLKPQRVKSSNSPQVGQNLGYEDSNNFKWQDTGSGVGDMKYSDFEWETLTGNAITIEDISNNITPSSNFTVSAGTVKPGIEYVLRVNTGNTAYTMTLGTGVINPNGYSTELAPNKVNQFKFIATSDSQLELEGVDTSEYLTGLTILSYGTSTWNDFITAYNKNAIVYCRASSNSNPATGAQNRLAFMAFVNNATNPTEVEFQYYRSRSDHNTAANQLDEVYVYKLTSSGTWTVTQRNTGAKAVAGTGISLGWGSGNMTISADTSVLATQTDLNSKANATDVNTKTFYLSNLSDLTTAQAAYDWYVSGKNPILVYSNCAYILVSADSSNVIFRSSKHAQTDNASYSAGKEWEIKFYLSSGTVTSYSNTNKEITPNVLATDVDYSTPYTPAYNGSPATKKYVDDKVISSATAPSSPTEGMLWYDTTNDQLKVYDGTNWKATGSEYSAGEGISIGSVVINGRQGPAPEGFHVPSVDEWAGLKDIMDSVSLSSGNDWKTNLYMPFSGYRYDDGEIEAQGTEGRYWSSTPFSGGTGLQDEMSYYLSIATTGYAEPREFKIRSYLYSIRCFKDTPVEIENPANPGGDWDLINNVGIRFYIYHSPSLGVITIMYRNSGREYITIADKNLGATTVYNDGDTLSEANCGKYYQWGNNYGFPWTGAITTSGTQVDASGYGPGNYYSSDTCITGYADWSSVRNPNLWGDITGTITQDAISNTGVLSVNGQTGDVTISGLPTGGTNGQIIMMVNGTPTWVNPADVGFRLQASDTEIDVPYVWSGTEDQYAARQSYSDDTEYHTV